MKIQRYISVIAVLVVGLFLVNAYWPGATFRERQSSVLRACEFMERAGHGWSRDSLYHIRAVHEGSGVFGGYSR